MLDWPSITAADAGREVAAGMAVVGVAVVVAVDSGGAAVVAAIGSDMVADGAGMLVAAGCNLARHHMYHFHY